MAVISDDLFVFYERLIGAGVVCMVTGSVGSSAIRESASSSGHFNIIQVDTGLKADLYPICDDPLLEYGLENATEIELAGEKAWRKRGKRGHALHVIQSVIPRPSTSNIAAAKIAVDMGPLQP